MIRPFALLLALVWDGLLGDPPNQWHPVAWMGRFIASVRRFQPVGSGREFAFGAALTVAGSALSAVLGFLASRSLHRFPAVVHLFGESFLLKIVLSWRGLWRAAAAVKTSLDRSDLTSARHWLAWHLVSRDTTALSANQVAAATIESVAENSSDSIIAPLCAYAVGGLPLAFAYRFVNTADAMLGYRDLEREWLGKFPARCDDLLNWLPARLSGALIAFAALFTRGSMRSAWQTMIRDAGKTESPNAGYPMSAMAGAVGVELEKIGQYRLGEGLRQPQRDDIAHTQLLSLITTLLAAFLLLPLAARYGRRHARDRTSE